MEQDDNRLKSATPPRQIILFSGHMVDRPDRAPPRFPNSKSGLASDAILTTLNELGANDADVAISSGACGGDLLFAQHCLDRGMPLHLYLPMSEPAFLQASVDFAGATWTKRYFRVRNHPNTLLYVLPDEVDIDQADENAFARNNRRMLYNALAFGADKVRFIALWNGAQGDGPGGTQDMIETVQKHLGQVRILDTKQIFA